MSNVSAPVFARTGARFGARPPRSRRLAALAVAALVACLGACQNAVGAAGGERGAAGEPVRILCSAAAEACRAWTQDFQQASGLSAVMLRLPTGEALARLRTYRDEPEFDVWVGGPIEGYVNAGAQGLLSAYTPPGADQIEPEFRSPTGLWHGVYIGVLSFCVNTQVTSRLGISEPRDWADLTDPALRGQISMPSPATSGTAYTLVWTQVELAAGQRAGEASLAGGQAGSSGKARQWAGPIDQAFAYLQRLHRNVLQYTFSGVAPANVAGRGEVAVGLVFDSHCQRARAQGMHWLRVVYPAAGTGYEVGGVAVIAGAVHPQGARAFVDYALSVRGQEQGYRVGVAQLPTNTSAPHFADFATRKSHLLSFDVEAAARYQEALTRRYTEQVAPQSHG